MNLSNKLTVLRVILIPFFIFFLMTEMFGNAGTGAMIALIIFCVASLTDMLDGKIARKYNLVTNFGKFMDPLADKLLVSSALICFIELRILPAWFVIVIIAREFIISGFRLVASDKGVVIAASMWGKVKTVFQMVMVIWFLLLLGLGADLYWLDIALCQRTDMTKTVEWTWQSFVGTGLAWIAFALTVISLIDYIIKNKDVMKDTK